jgi:hypothetical protein
MFSPPTTAFSPVDAYAAGLVVAMGFYGIVGPKIYPRPLPPSPSN